MYVDLTYALEGKGFTFVLVDLHTVDVVLFILVFRVFVHVAYCLFFSVHCPGTSSSGERIKIDR